MSKGWSLVCSRLSIDNYLVRRLECRYVDTTYQLLRTFRGTCAKLNMSNITPKSQRRRGKVHHSIEVSSFLLPVGDVSTYGRGTQDPNIAADLLHGGWSGRSVQCRWRYSQSDIVSGRVITSRFLHPVRDGRGWTQEPATAADLLHSSWPDCAVRC